MVRNRRLFQTVVATAALSALVLAEFLPPASNAAIHIDGGASNPVGPLNTTLVLTPSQTNSNGPWTFGQPLKAGDVPAGNSISCSNTSACQAEIRNYWPDGSAKFAVISGISNFAAKTSLTVILTANSGAPTCTPVAEPSNMSLPYASVVFTTISGDRFSIASGGTYNLNSVIGVAQGSWSTTNRGRVRSIRGCVMSEFHYYQPTSDPNLSIWWYVRAYKTGAVEVEVEIENGWFNKSGPTQRDYGVAIYLGSSTAVYRTSYLGWGLSGEPQYSFRFAKYISNPSEGTLTAPNAITAGGSGVLPSGVRFYCNDNTSTIYTVSSYRTFGSVIMVQSGERLPSSVSSVTIIGHPSHMRWGWVGWYSGGAPVVPAHNSFYFLATELVPNYGYWNPSKNRPIRITPDSSAWVGPSNSAITSTINPPPFYPGDIDLIMAAAGYHEAIGVLPRIEALYAATANSQAYIATIGNTRSGDAAWPYFYRDEKTGRPINYLSYPDETLLSNWGTTQPPNAAGTLRGHYKDPWDVAHHPSVGYLAYLIEGRYSQLETLEFSASYAIMQSNPAARERGGVLQASAQLSAPITTRGFAWAFRTMSEAAAIGPRDLGGSSSNVPSADSTLTSGYVQSIHDTVNYLCSTYIPASQGGSECERGAATGAWANSLGYIGQYDGVRGTQFEVETTEGSTTATMASGDLPAYLFVGAYVDGPNATTGIPAGAQVTSLATSSFTFAPSAYISGGAYPSGYYVTYNGYDYQAAQALPTGQAPSGSRSSNSYWNYVSNYGALSTGTYHVKGGQDGGTSTWAGEFWMVMFQIDALAAGYDLGIEGLSNQSTLGIVRNFSFNNILLLMNTGSSTSVFPFPNACTYSYPILLNYGVPNTSYTPQFPTVQQMWQYLKGWGQNRSTNVALSDYTATARQDLHEVNSETPTGTADASTTAGKGYWAQCVGPIAYAVDAGVTNASTAWELMTSAANYEPTASGSGSDDTNDTPQFSFVPRRALREVR